jgi:hypothetical protein
MTTVYQQQTFNGALLIRLLCKKLQTPHDQGNHKQGQDQ